MSGSTAAAPLRRALVAQLGASAAPMRAAVRAARALGIDTFAVGGPVRDLLLGRPVDDIDVLVGTRLGAVARRAGAESGARVVLHARFLTATLEGDGWRLDLAQARRERYARPGALPEVEPAPVLEDFARRDFTINAMALPLDAAAGRSLLDPCGGRSDLAARRLAILHPESFTDDPTRLFRGARFGARLGFRFDAESERAARRALREGHIDAVSGDRLAHELELAFDESRPRQALETMHARGLLRAISPGLSFGRRSRERFERLARARRSGVLGADTPAVWRGAAWRLLLAGRPSGVAPVLTRLARAGRSAKTLAAEARSLAGRARNLEGLGPAALDGRLVGLDAAGVLAVACAAPALVAPVRRWSEGRHTRPLDGHAARAIGARGPEIGALLAAARRRDLGGRAVDRAWARQWLARHRRN